MSAVFIGIAGGAASALLFAAVARGGALAMPLFVLASLPIAIASIGWGTLCGAVAAAAAAVVAGLLVSPEAALGHAVVFGLPMAVYGHLLGLARPTGDGLEWYPLSRVLAAIVLLTATSIVVAGVASGFDVEEMAGEVTDMVVAIAASQGDADLPDRGALLAMMRVYMSVAPLALAIFWVGAMSFNLWLGARVVRMSGRLQRPEESIAETIDLPPAFAGLLVAAVVLTVVLGGSAGIVASVFAGCLMTGFALIGLAALHIHLRGNPAAGLILTLTYAATFVVSLPLIPLAVAGLLDRPLGIRRKRLAKQRSGG